MQTNNEHNKTTVGIFLTVVGAFLIIAGAVTLAYISVNGGIFMISLGAIAQGAATSIALTRRIEIAPHDHENVAPHTHKDVEEHHHDEMSGDVKKVEPRRSY